MSTSKFTCRGFLSFGFGLIPLFLLPGFFVLGQQPLPFSSRQGNREDQSAVVKVMSFNIRYGSANDGNNRWELRKEFLVDTIKRFHPDLLGTQETLAAQKQYLDEKLTDYESIGVGRDDGKQQGEMTALWFRRHQFDLLDSGHFWLSESPNDPGSVSWDSSLTRMASWVKLRQRKNAQENPILFVNTHFDHRGGEARRQSAILLRRMASQLGEGCDIVITGDFNAAEGSPPYKELFSIKSTSDNKDSLVLVDSYRKAHPSPNSSEGTFNGFKPDQTGGPRIDWIGVSSSWKVLAAGIDRSDEDGRVPSDHFPVTAELDR
jgi:endonuclease/exonuclease/phosphatase family metal-dependent hydrolase